MDELSGVHIDTIKLPDDVEEALRIINDFCTHLSHTQGVGFNQRLWKMQEQSIREGYAEDQGIEYHDDLDVKVLANQKAREEETARAKKAVAEAHNHAGFKVGEHWVARGNVHERYVILRKHVWEDHYTSLAQNGDTSIHRVMRERHRSTWDTQRIRKGGKPGAEHQMTEAQLAVGYEWDKTKGGTRRPCGECEQWFEGEGYLCGECISR